MSDHDEQPELPEMEETPGRRHFLKMVAGVIGGGIGLILAVPLVGSLVGKIYHVQKSFYAKVTDLASVPVGQPKDVNFAYTSRDAFMTTAGVRDVWVIKHSADSVTVFSPICPHLGCHYNWDAKAHQFRCPCHGSVFAITGEVLGGPAPRPLDTLPHKIENGELFVKWERFEVGMPKKVRV